MIHQSQPFGQEISCIMKNIGGNFLSDNQKLKHLILDSLKKFKFGILDVQEKCFEPYGYTLLVLLSESHLAIHTYPEYGSLYFNMYSCRGPKDAEPTFEILKRELKPKKILFYREDVIPVKD